MRARRTFRTRLCSVVLTACMVGSLLPMSVLSLAAEGSGPVSVSWEPQKQTASGVGDIDVTADLTSDSDGSPVAAMVEISLNEDEASALDWDSRIRISESELTGGAEGTTGDEESTDGGVSTDDEDPTGGGEHTGGEEPTGGGEPTGGEDPTDDGEPTDDENSAGNEIPADDEETPGTVEAAVQPETLVLSASMTEPKTGAVLIDKTDGGGAVLRILLAGGEPYNKTLTFSASGDNVTVAVDENDIRAVTYGSYEGIPNLTDAPLLTGGEGNVNFTGGDSFEILQTLPDEITITPGDEPVVLGDDDLKPIQYTVTIQKPDSGDISEGSSGKDYAFTLEWPEGLSRPEGLLTLTGTDDGDNQCNITCGGETLVTIGCADGVTVSEVATTDNGLTFILTAAVATESGPDSGSEYEVPITVNADTFTRTPEFTSGAVTLSTTNSEEESISASVEVTAEQSGLPGDADGFDVVVVEKTSIDQTVGWADGNNEADIRPGWSLDLENAVGALVPTLYFTIDGVTHPLTADNWSAVGLDKWPDVTVDPSGSKFTISELPSKIQEKSEYAAGATYDVTWSLEPPAVPDGYAFVEVTEENKNNYSSVDGTLGWYYMLQDEFTFRVEAKMGADSSLSSDKVRAILRNFEFKWSYGTGKTGERSIEDLIVNGLAEGKFDNTENEVTISGLWRYNLDGSPIEYSVAAIGDDKLTADYLGENSGLLPDEEEDYLQVLYSNSGVPNHPSDTDAVYNGGALQLILSGETTFQAEKIWLDQNPSEGLETRPDVTFTLYRYRLDEGYGTAAQVEVLPSADYGKDNNPIPKDSGEAGDEENPDNPDSSGEGTTEPEVEYYYYVISGGENLPKYDADGYPYVYGVREHMEYGNGDNRYETVYGVVGKDDQVVEGSDQVPYEGKRASGDDLIYNNGVVTNRLTDSVSVPVTKTWEAAAYQSEFNDVAVELTLQSRVIAEPENEWENVTEDGAVVTHYLHRFSEVSLSESYTANWPQYDGQGRELEYQWVETAVYQGITGTTDEEAAEQIARASTEEDAEIRKIPVTNNSFTLTQDGTSVAYVSEVSSDGKTITNRIQDEITYDVIKEWKEETQKSEITINIYQYLNSIDLTSVYVSFSFDANGVLKKDYTLSDNIPEEIRENIRIEPKTENGQPVSWQVEITGLPRFDEGGHPYSYALLEEGGFPTYETKRNEQGNYTTTVINGGPGEAIPILIQKVWLDDGDDLHREPVTFTIYNADTNKPLKKGEGDYTVTLGDEATQGVWYTVEYVPKDAYLEGNTEKENGVYDIDDLYVVETIVGSMR